MVSFVQVRISARGRESTMRLVVEPEEVDSTALLEFFNKGHDKARDLLAHLPRVLQCPSCGHTAEYQVHMRAPCGTTDCKAWVTVDSDEITWDNVGGGRW